MLPAPRCARFLTSPASPLLTRQGASCSSGLGFTPEPVDFIQQGLERLPFDIVEKVVVTLVAAAITKGSGGGGGGGGAAGGLDGDGNGDSDGVRVHIVHTHSLAHTHKHMHTQRQRQRQRQAPRQRSAVQGGSAEEQLVRLCLELVASHQADKASWAKTEAGLRATLDEVAAAAAAAKSGQQLSGSSGQQQSDDVEQPSD